MHNSKIVYSWSCDILWNLGTSKWNWSQSWPIWCQIIPFNYIYEFSPNTLHSICIHIKFLINHYVPKIYNVAPNTLTQKSKPFIIMFSWNILVSFCNIQHGLIAAQDIGADKLVTIQAMSDLIENKSRQLDHDSKNLNFGKDDEDEPVKTSTKAQQNTSINNSSNTLT